MVSFEAIRKWIDPLYEDAFLRAVIRSHHDTLRTARRTTSGQQRSR